MNILLMTAAFAGGALAAYIYTGLLWESVRTLTVGKKNMALIIGGFVLRIGLCLAVFIAAGYNGNFYRLFACAAGFIIMRGIRVNTLKNKKMKEGKTGGN
jgi:F1F0 ATPase subunit 2